jgi:hypothetical protein
LIGWVKEDAEFLVERITALQEAQTRVPERAPEPVAARNKEG